LSGAFTIKFLVTPKYTNKFISDLVRLSKKAVTYARTNAFESCNKANRAD